MTMQRKAGIMTVVMLVGSLFIAGIALGDDDDKDKFGGRSRYTQSVDVPPVTDETYKQECGSCHFAYQPGLLPARSWTKLMATLEDHFGDNAELDADAQKTITAYLVKNAADHSSTKTSVKILRSIGGDETPIAISKTPYFIRKHDEIPSRMVTGNPRVKSYAHCAKCHTKAAEGSYNEHQVNIPGYGPFED